MSAAPPPVVFPSDSYREALAGVVAMLPTSFLGEHDDSVCAEVARAIDALLVRVARGQGALDLAMGARLGAIAKAGPLRLGYSSIGDYACERHGIPSSTAEKMARLAQNLCERSLLRAAVWEGAVTTRKAEVVLRAARGDDEAAWVARARDETVRALKETIPETEEEAHEDERWVRLRVNVPAPLRPALDEAVELAGEIVGARAPKWRRFEALCQQVIGTFGDPTAEGAADDSPESAVNADHGGGALEEFLEKESARWSALGEPAPISVPGPSLLDDTDLWRLDEEMRELNAMRCGWDELLGRLALLAHATRTWELLGFASFGHYCAERLGLRLRAVQQRIALERRLQELASLREALRSKRVSYEKARLIARHADAASVGRWIELAERVTGVELRDRLGHDEEAQMCARREFGVWMPAHLAGLAAAAFAAIRRAVGRPLTTGECIGHMGAHFVEVWKPILERKMTRHRRILERDRRRCQVPGCSRAAVQVHHIDYRSHGGGDEPENLVSACAAHHLHGIHMGWIRVRRIARDQLRWQLGVRAGFAPLVDVTVPAPWCADGLSAAQSVEEKARRCG